MKRLTQIVDELFQTTGKHRALRSFLGSENSLLLGTCERKVVARSVTGREGTDLRNKKDTIQRRRNQGGETLITQTTLYRRYDQSCYVSDRLGFV